MRLYAYSDLQMDGALRWRVIVDSTLLLEPSYSIEQLRGLLTALLLSGIDLQAHISRAEQEEEANAFNAALKAAQETSERAIVARDNH